MSAWFNRPLSSCKRRQGVALLYLATLPNKKRFIRLPSAGGVYSPGYAFADTTLVSRLQIHFQLQMTQRNCVPISKKNKSDTKPIFVHAGHRHLSTNFSFRLNKKDVTFTSVVEDI